MNTDKLKLLKSEEEVKEYARVNGYDLNDTNNLVEQWMSTGKKPLKKGTKTTMMTPEEDSLVEKK